MVVRIASVALTLAGSIALVLGILFWFGTALNLISVHMLLGLLAVAALWVIAITQAIANRGGWALAAISILIGGITAGLGMVQSSLMVGAFHWVIQIIHLFLGLLTIGLGHVNAARYRKSGLR